MDACVICVGHFDILNLVSKIDWDHHRSVLKYSLDHVPDGFAGHLLIYLVKYVVQYSGAEKCHCHWLFSFPSCDRGNSANVSSCNVIGRCAIVCEVKQ